MGDVVVDTLTVRLLGFPVRLHARAQQHAEGMRREFFLVMGQERVHPGSVPSRLLELSTALSIRYGGLTVDQEREIHEALEAGRDRIDELRFTVPATVAQVVDELETVLDEADEWCREGALLCLATPPDLVAYRRWYLDAFRRQAAGHAAEPWSGPLR